MIKNGYPCGDTFGEIVDCFHLNAVAANKMFADLRAEGYSAKGVCFGVGKSEEKLLSFVGDSRIYGVMKNEVRKNSWKTGDSRWDDRKRK